MAICTRQLIRTLGLPHYRSILWRLPDGEAGSTNYLLCTKGQFRTQGWAERCKGSTWHIKHLGPLVFAITIDLPRWKTPELPPAWMTDWSAPTPLREEERA